MMVLASVYLSVSASLPSTPVIKPVERWLLFSLSYPFFVIVLSTVRLAAGERLGGRERSAKLRSVKVRPREQLGDLTMQTNDIMSEVQFRRILCKTLDKTLEIFLPLVFVMFAVFYWIEYTLFTPVD